MSGNGDGARPELPEGWGWATIGDSCLPVDKIEPGLTPREPFCYIDISAIDRTAKTIGDVQRILGEAAPSRARQLVKTGDILVSTVRPNLQTIAVVPQELDGEVASTGFCVLRPDEGLDPRWLFYWTLSPTFLESLLKKARGVSYPAVLDKDVRAEPIPLPPIDEQREIVETIKRRLADISRGVSMLSPVAARLGEFRASMREAACLGTLLDPGRCRSAGGDGPSPLPDGWEWKNLGEMAADGPRSITDGPFGSNLKSSHYTGSGPRVIRLQNVGDGVFLDAEVHISPSHFETLRAHEAVAGDVVMASLGDDLPRACVVPDWLGPAIVKADCPRVRPSPNVNPDFLAECLNSRPVRRQAEGVVHGMGRSRLKLTDAKALKVPVPPLAEQDEIAARLTALQAGALRLERERDGALTAAEAVRRALLQDAMRGSMALPRRESQSWRQTTTLR